MMKTILKYKIKPLIRPDTTSPEYELMEVKDNLIKSTILSKEEAKDIINEFDMEMTLKNEHGTMWEQEKGFLKQFINNHEIQFED